MEDLLDEFMPEIAPAFLARAVPAACASLAAAHVVKTRSKHSGPEAVADLLLQEYVNGVLRKLCTEAIGELVDDHFFDSAANAVRPTMRKPKGNPKMASSSSDTSLDVGSSSGSDSDDEQLGHDGWGDRGGGGWEDRDHEASAMAMNGQNAFEDAMAAACRNAESDEAKRNSQGSAGEATAALDPATDDEPAAAANPAAAAEPAASRRRHTSSRDADTPAAASIGGEAANVLADRSEVSLACNILPCCCSWLALKRHACVRCGT